MEKSEESILHGYLTKPQLAQALGKSLRTLDRWHVIGDGPPRVEIGRTVLYSRTSIEDWLKGRERRRHSRKASARAQ